MKNEIETLKSKIRELEKENQYLKEIIKSAGLSYELKEHKGDVGEITYEHARLFFSYFWGRTDVYAKRYKNKKTGATGYFPQCNNFWKYGICPKAERLKIQCKECDNKSWIKLGANQIIAHLKGEDKDCTDVIGVYPIWEDETCRFIVFDFDNHNEADDIGYSENDKIWVEEVAALREICKQNNIPVLVERSRSGKGAHVWIFFDKPIDVTLARRFGFALLDKGAESVNLKSFRFYDRMLPGQDGLKAGGLGNLIALPLQGQAVKLGNSVFVDENWNAFDDQWKTLKATAKISKDRIEQFIDLYKEKSCDISDGIKPWDKSKSFCKEDVSGQVNITIANCIYIEKQNLAPRLQNQLRRMAAISNPAFFKNNALGLSNYNNSRFIYLGYDEADYICIPRGLIEELESRLKNAGIEYAITDERKSGHAISVEFNGKLKEEQKRAVEEIVKYDTGILSAATAFGKTVVCSNMISRKKASTLILLESSALIEQWKKTLENFLLIDEELPQYTTPSGRVKTRKSHIGIIHGAKDTSTGIIDIAMVGSLKKNGEFHDRLQSYGMVIVDECHHSASDTIKEVLSEISAKYVYGVTATPFRGDGLEKINNMLLGPIRFQYTSKEKAESQGIEHIVIPRFTRVVNPHGRDKIHVNDAYEVIRTSEIRNEQIVEDIKVCIENRRTPVVLSKYKEHAELLYEKAKDFADKSFLLTGALSKKEQRQIRSEMESVTDNETMLLVATGQLIGEGFDFPRLDTLIMATPVAGKGLVEQYAGRLNRDYPGKQDVIVYDYIDSNLKVFDNMYSKRLRAYKRIGYSIMTRNSKNEEQLSAIYDFETYLETFNKDLMTSEKSIVISSPALGYKKTVKFIDDVKLCQERGVKVTVVTWDPDVYGYSDSTHRIEMIMQLRESGIIVETVGDACQHYAVIDNKIVWYGSMNLLAKEDVDDNIMRIESEDIAAEILEITFGLH